MPAGSVKNRAATRPAGQPGPDHPGDAGRLVLMTDHVTFYWRPGCPFCVSLRRGLHRRGIPFDAVNIWEDPEAAARVRAAASGNETVPTVVIGKHALVNPSVAQVEALIRRAAPDIAAQLPESGKKRWWRR